jgi:hypothetical protein
MHPDHFYLLSLTHPLKILWLWMFAPAFVAACIYAVRAPKAKAWLATVILAAVFTAHVTYSAIAPALYSQGRWYARDMRKADAPNLSH